MIYLLWVDGKFVDGIVLVIPDDGSFVIVIDESLLVAVIDASK